MQNNT